MVISPLMVLLIAMAVALLVALAECGADLDKADSDGATPLMCAAGNGRSGAVLRLLELGADDTPVGTGGRWGGKTALEAAAGRGRGAAADLLRSWAAGTRDATELGRLIAWAPTAEDNSCSRTSEDDAEGNVDDAVLGFMADDY